MQWLQNLVANSDSPKLVTALLILAVIYLSTAILSVFEPSATRAFRIAGLLGFVLTVITILFFI